MTLEEGKHTGEFVVSEANGFRSREAVTVTVPATTTLKAGTVLGIVTADGKYAPLDQFESDGTEVAKAVLYDNVVNDGAQAADKKATVIRRDAEVRAADLVWPSSISAQDLATATGQLADEGIIAR